jgi:SAM-dependent methyltransferase
MPLDIRAGPAKFYDLSPHQPNDIPFYLERLPSPNAHVLELGCGTGRVVIPVAQRCGFLHGIDLSEAMLQVCRAKLKAAGLGEHKVKVGIADITNYDLGERFDLVIAPFRVIQNLETDEQLAGLFRCLRRHLAADGRCILNVFHPNRSLEAMRHEWVSNQENLAWEVEDGGERVACYDVRRRLSHDPLVLYPDLVYRRYVGADLVEQVVLTIPMRCFYPDEFIALIEAEGGKVLGTWGGYGGEEYGAGNELVVEFSMPV